MRGLGRPTFQLILRTDALEVGEPEYYSLPWSFIKAGGKPCPLACSSFNSWEAKMHLNWDDPSLVGMIYTMNCAQILFHMETTGPHMWCTALLAYMAAGTASSCCSHLFEKLRHNSPAQGHLKSFLFLLVTLACLAVSSTGQLTFPCYVIRW